MSTILFSEIDFINITCGQVFIILGKFVLIKAKCSQGDVKKVKYVENNKSVKLVSKYLSRYYCFKSETEFTDLSNPALSQPLV